MRLCCAARGTASGWQRRDQRHRSMAFEKNFFPRQVVEAGNRWDWALLPLVLAVLVLLGLRRLADGAARTTWASRCR